MLKLNKLAKLSINWEVLMKVKSINSTMTQNNFGQVLDDVIQNQTRYIIKRHKKPRAILLSLMDFAQLLNDVQDRQQVHGLISEIQPKYDLGTPIGDIE
jgi:PHD/YefM family antitoxin component YafN of YafNO toxin-antitoxin module